MAKPQSKDLFDDSVMTFGEHLEVLRIHLWKAIIGLFIGMAICLTYGDRVVAIIRKPIDDALHLRNVKASRPLDVVDIEKNFNFWDQIKEWMGYSAGDVKTVEKTEKTLTELKATSTLPLQIKVRDFAAALHEAYPDKFPAPEEPKPAAEEPATAEGEVPGATKGAKEGEPSPKPEPTITLPVSSEYFRQFQDTVEKTSRPITLTVQEAFMTYLKVSFISGLVLSSPWVIYQLWLFVAAGLYPHEKKYVYIYLPVSIFLFLGGVLFCFFAVFPVALNFMLQYNDYMEVEPQIRLSDWINFAVMFPLMFGISFQLPLVMLFLERISVFEVQTYREKRRLAILAIAIVSMILTPTPDPLSMLTMMFPLLVLYELGIVLCKISPAKSPFESEAA